MEKQEMNTQIEETNTQTDGDASGQGGKTFTQDDVNRIVQDRLAKEKGKQNDELARRAAELDKRERRMNAIQKLRDNNLPDYLVDALNLETDEAFDESINAILKMKNEGKDPKPTGTKVNLIGAIGQSGSGDSLRQAFGLDG